MSYINADDLLFNNDTENGIHSGGFSVNSIMMKKGISPIMTINDSQFGGSNLVSDLFNKLVVPNWVLSHTDKKLMGGTSDIFNDSDSDSDSDSDDDTMGGAISDDLHNKLLELVKEPDNNNEKKPKKRLTKRKKAKNTGTKKIK